MWKSTEDTWLVEESQSIGRALIGRRIEDHRLFLKPYKAELLIRTNGGAGTLLLQASTSLNDWDEDHNLTRVFLTDENGSVKQGFPEDLEVEEVAYQKAVCDREYMACGYRASGESVTAIKLSFQSTERIVRLHCWSQCKDRATTCQNLLIEFFICSQHPHTLLGVWDICHGTASKFYS